MIEGGVGEDLLQIRLKILIGKKIFLNTNLTHH